MITSIDNIVDNSKASIDKSELKELLSMLLAHRTYYHDVLEIGVHRGYSLDVWGSALQPNKVVGIEPDVTSLDKSYYEKYTIIVEDSHSYIAKSAVERHLAHGIDFLWIDGDHSYEGVKKDFEMYSPMVKSNGVIAIHDILSEQGVKEYWKELSEIESDFTTINKKEGIAIILR